MGEMRAELLRQVSVAGGVNAFCRARGIESHTAVSLAIAGHRNVTEALANAIGYIAETTFVRFGELT